MSKYKSRYPIIAMGLFSCLGSINTYSASAPGMLEQVIVTASRTQERVFDSSASLSVINEEEISRAIAPNLAEAMRDVPGVQVTDSGQPGLGRIRIRGEESRRTAILINSQEVTDHYEVGTPLTLSPALVEQIEIIRGSGAVLYGSRALSGVVNFVTKKGGSEPVQATLSGSYLSATEAFSSLASIYGNAAGIEYRLAWSETDSSDRKTPAGTIDDTAFNNDDLYFYIGHNFGAHRLEYIFDDYHSNNDIYVEEEVKTTFPITDFYLKTPKRDRLKHGLFYEWDVDNSWLSRLSANGFVQRSERHFYNYTETVFFTRDTNSYSDLDSDGALLQLDFQPLGDAHTIILGIQYSYDDIDQKRHIDTLSFVPPTVSGIEVIKDKANIETWAWFVQDQWSINDSVIITAGLRQYFVDGELHYSNRASLSPGKMADDNEIIGSLGLVWEVSDTLHLRSNISEGYVYPSLTQLATGAYAGSSFVNPDSTLKPETSTNYELGLRIQNAGLILDATAFYTESNDYIDHLACTPENNCPGVRDRYYTNIGESEARGIELQVSYQLQTLRLQPYTNLTWMERRNHYEDFSTSKTAVPSLAGRAGLRWQSEGDNTALVWTDFYLRGETSSKLQEPGSSAVVESRESWVTINLASGLEFGAHRQYQLSVNLLNLSNKQYIPSAENLYGIERSINLNFTLDI